MLSEIKTRNGKALSSKLEIDYMRARLRIAKLLLEALRKQYRECTSSPKLLRQNFSFIDELDLEKLEEDIKGMEAILFWKI